MLGSEYAVLFAAEGSTLDQLTPVYAAGILLVAELAFWSIERRVAAWSEPTALEWRLARLGATCVGAAGVAALATLSAAAATGGGGVVLESFGVGAAIGVRRHPGPAHAPVVPAVDSGSWRRFFLPSAISGA